MAAFQRTIYSLLLTLGLPLIICRLWIRGIKNPDYRRRWSERLGKAYRPQHFSSQKITIWFHTVSVGEFIASRNLIKELIETKKYNLYITSTTPTGSKQIQKFFGNPSFHSYIPYDLPVFLRRFLSSIKPDIAIFMETELWPNTLNICNRYGISSLLINARMSEKSALGYNKFSSLTVNMLNLLSHVGCQTKEHKEHFVRLGCPPERCTIDGNLKFDIQLNPELKDKASAFRDDLGKEKFIWIAASTHRGEDEIILQAHLRLLERNTSSFLILVPRHPERFVEVEHMIEKYELKYLRKTQLIHRKPIGAEQVLLGDTMGELMEMYGAAKAAFVGGSLVDKGGHNTLEAAAWGMPIITGPSNYNFSEITRLLRKSKALLICRNADDLASKLLTLLDVDLASKLGSSAKEVLEQNSGSTQRVLARIQQTAKARGEKKAAN